MSEGRRAQSDGAAGTEALAAKLARTLRPGDVVLVQGELGAGKTTFVRGACRALGVSARVRSPTFTIGHRYPAPVPVSHLDLFRLSGLAAEEPDLLADYVTSERITFIEWPTDTELVLGFGTRIAARVEIEHAGADLRLISIESAA